MSCVERAHQQAEGVEDYGGCEPGLQLERAETDSGEGFSVSMKTIHFKADAGK
jgi:hypothetical protein